MAGAQPVEALPYQTAANKQIHRQSHMTLCDEVVIADQTGYIERLMIDDNACKSQAKRHNT